MDNDKIFWMNNFREHLLFVMEHLHNNKNLYDEAQHLYDSYYDYSMFLTLHLISKFNNKIRNLSLRNMIDVPKGLIDHQIEEYEFFMRKILNETTDIEEIIFWNNNDMEHLQINLKHLDDEDVRMISICNTLISEFKKLQSQSDDITSYFLQRSLELGISTDVFHRSIKYSSISHDLLNHIIDEGKRGILSRIEILDI